MPPNLEKRTGWKLAVFQTLSCTLPKFSEAYQSLEFTGCSTFGTSFLVSFCMKFSSGSIFSVHLETLVTTGAPKGKMARIWHPPWVPFGDHFQSFFGQKSFGNQKSCHCKLHGAGTCESHESCRKKSDPGTFRLELSLQRELNLHNSIRCQKMSKMGTKNVTLGRLGVQILLFFVPPG